MISGITFFPEASSQNCQYDFGDYSFNGRLISDLSEWFLGLLFPRKPHLRISKWLPGLLFPRKPHLRIFNMISGITFSSEASSQIYQNGFRDYFFPGSLISESSDSQALGCDINFLPQCTHAFSEFSRFPAQMQWVVRFVGIFDRLIHRVHP